MIRHRSWESARAQRSLAVPLALLAWWSSATALAAPFPALPGLEDEPLPNVQDAQLSMELFAQSPQVVTPVGLAVDKRGRLFVIESHTHSPPQDYTGPQHDRIKILEDRNHDGKADTVKIFSEGVLEDVMNLVFAPDGTLYAIHRLGATALPDRNNDDRADEHDHVVRVTTQQTYDHSGLLSGAISADGWLYLGRGNAAGFDYTYEGKDGNRLRSYGDGGHIVRCRLDGSGLQRYATGFWNPFGLAFDGTGRLWAADNDPDSRGPNRVLQIVPGGDYGYRSRYGSSGLHPYVAWNGDLPGTHPYVAGTGESPGGILDADTTALPSSYRGDLLVAVWAENSVERFTPQMGAQGLQAKRSVLIKGGRNFRPVAFAASRDGSVFISDWVKREYPNHGLGRIWRLQTLPKGRGGGRLVPRPAFAPPTPDEHTQRLWHVSTTDDLVKLDEALAGDDLRLRSAAAYRLAEPGFRDDVMKRLRHENPLLRQGALQALRWAGGAEYPFARLGRKRLAPLLADPDEAVRTLALLYAGESVDLSVRADLSRALAHAPVGERLVQVYLATLALLTREEQRHLEKRLPRSTVSDVLSPATAWKALQDRRLNAEVHAMLLPYLTVPRDQKQLAFVLRASQSRNRRLQTEALRTLGLAKSPSAQERLVRVALDGRHLCEVRQEAVVALAAQPEALPRLLPLLQGSGKGPAKPTGTTPCGETGNGSDPLLLTLVRALRAAAGNAEVQQALAELSQRTAPGGPFAASLAFTQDPGAAADVPGRPQTPADWWAATRQGGDPAQGRHLFYHPLLACSRCHSVGGRGGHIGPNLSHVGSSMDRARLLDSLLNPSAEISPEFQAYAVVKKTGETLTGVQFHFRSPTSASMHMADGTDIELRLSEVESYGAMDASLMPQGLEFAMTADEMRDLLAFLESLR